MARRRESGTTRFILINDAPTLAWCANLAAIELHPFLHRVENLDRPTCVALDLDPGDGADILTCARVALLIKELLDGLQSKAWPKVSGSKGLQVYVPLNSKVTYDAAGAFANGVARLLENQHPKMIVSHMAKVRRKGRVLIDWSQNSGSKTVAVPFKTLLTGGGEKFGGFNVKQGRKQQRASRLSGHRHQLFPTLFQRNFELRFSVPMNQVEEIINDGRPGPGQAATLKELEPGMAVRVKRDDLTIERG